MLLNPPETTRSSSTANPVWTRPLSQLWQVPMFFLGLLLLVGVCVARPPWRPVDTERAERELAAVRQVLEQPKLDRNQLLSVVERLEENQGRLAHREAEVRFLLGTAYLGLAGNGAAPEQQQFAWQARRHLEEVEKLGIAESELLRLDYRLAKARVLTGGDLSPIIEALSRSIENGSDDPFEGYGLLVQAYLRLPTPDVPSALKANEKQLQLPLLDDEVLAPARLLRGELLLQMKKPDEARIVLANIGSKAPPALQGQARFLRAMSLQQEARWSEAAGIWKDMLEDKRIAPREPGWTLYYLGVCYRQLEQLAEAARAWAACAERVDGGEEGVAAALGLAEVRLLENSPEAIAAFERAIRDVKGPTEWRNSLIDLERVRALFDRGCAIYREAGDFERSIQLARVYDKLAPPGMASHLRGQAADAGAKLRQGDEARALHLQAGEAYEQSAAESTEAMDQRERLWLSADRYQKAGDFPRSVAVLERYLKIEDQIQRLGEGWYRLAEAHRALKNPLAAPTAYRLCMRYTTPYAYRARYQLAMIEIASGNIDDAIPMLELNLNQLNYDPESDAEEKSLYTLAHLYFNRRNYHQAIARLEQALQTYPNSPGAVRGRFQLAECHRLLAAFEIDRLKQPGISVENQRNAKEQYDREIGLAAKDYQELIAVLSKRPVESLTEEEERYFRQSVFGAAEARFYLGQWEEAIPLYDQMAAQGIQRLEEVYALNKILLCRQIIRRTALENPRLRPDERQAIARREEELARAALNRFRAALKTLDDKAFENEQSTRRDYELILQSWEKWVKEF